VQLLLGMLRLPAHESAGIGPRVLADLGVTLDRARAEVQRRVSGPAPGLTAEDAEALRTIGIDVDEIRRRVEEAFGPGALDAPVGAARRWRSPDCAPMGPVFTAEAKQALELASRESIRLSHQYVGPNTCCSRWPRPTGPPPTSCESSTPTPPWSAPECSTSRAAPPRASA